MTSKAFELAQLGDAVTVDGSNVGIGCTPDTPLEVQLSSSGNAVKLSSSADGASVYLAFEQQESGTKYVRGRIRAASNGANGGLIFETGSSGSMSEHMRIDESGKVKITAADDIVTIKSTATSGTKTLMLFHDGADTYCGQINMDTSANTVGYHTASDHRLKENVTGISDGITRVKQLAPKRFNFIADANKTVDGFLAHEAQAVVPEAVAGTHNEVDDDNNPVYQGIDQAKLVPILTAALQEAITEIETLKTKVAALEAGE